MTLWVRFRSLFESEFESGNRFGSFWGSGSWCRFRCGYGFGSELNLTHARALNIVSDLDQGVDLNIDLNLTLDLNLNRNMIKNVDLGVNLNLNLNTVLDLDLGLDLNVDCI